MRIALIQLNPTVGDVTGNTRRLEEALLDARQRQADLCIAPELALTGYPPRDLLDRPELQHQVDQALRRLAGNTRGGPALIVGAPRPASTSLARTRGLLVAEDAPSPHDTPGTPLANAALLLDEGRLIAERHKTLLPDYDVFHESRHFRPANGNSPVRWRDRRLGLTICEDLWNDPTFWAQPRYPTDPVQQLADQGIDLLVNISASPFSLRKPRLRRRMLAHTATRLRVPIVWVNQIGANDDLIFDGEAMVHGPDGTLRLAGPPFREAVCIHDLDGPPGAPPQPALDDIEALHAALTLGIRDYVRKTGFQQVLLGLSGGIDSALTAALAVDAIGPENVLGVALPSDVSSADSLTDARALADRLGIRLHEIPIAPAFHTLASSLGTVLDPQPPGLMEENLQSRIRGTLLMALSNRTGRLLLTTGNKSELAVGYCTLYGDMNGALAVIADVSKTLVWTLSRWMNREQERIPVNSIRKPPSAELRPGQLDQDSLPPYDVLDDIIERWVEKRESAREIIAAGHDDETVRHVLRLLRINEYKRHQAPPVLKVTRRAFGSGWRMPLAARGPGLDPDEV